MAQSSGPITSGTLAERQMTDALWRDIFGFEAGVIGDIDGTAYKLTFTAGSDFVAVGSTTIDSFARVAGFSHKVPVSSPESINIPVAASTRTDVIAIRYDPAHTGALGPCRLVRIAGTSAAIPTLDTTAPGVEELPLWAITRGAGQALNQATVTDLRWHLTGGNYAKMWRTGGAGPTMTGGSPATVDMTTHRQRGGFVFDTAANTLSIPRPMICDIDVCNYASGGAGYIVTGSVRRTRTSVADKDIATSPLLRKEDSNDDRVIYTASKVPLQAGDKLMLRQNHSLTGGNYYGFDEVLGTYLVIRYVSPLGGATPI